MKVFLLITCRNPRIEDTSLLTLDTIRTGFPDCHIHADFQGKYASEVRLKNDSIDSSSLLLNQEIHGDWIRKLVYSEEKPFIIADPDLWFFSRFPFEKYEGVSLAGDVTPSFMCPVAKCRTEWRFHTSLLYIDPLLLRIDIRKWQSRIGDTPFTPPIDLFRAAVIPGAEGSRFYDTCSLLSQVADAEVFDADTLDCYEHLHAGSWSDIVEKSMPGFQAMHADLLKNPKSIKGLRKRNLEFYEGNK